MALSDKIVQLRAAKGWSTVQLAQESGVSRPYLWQLEKGNKDSPSIKTLEKLAHALGVSVTELIEVKETPQDGESLPTSLQEFYATRGAALGVTRGDLSVLRQIHFRGSQPKGQEDWELLYLCLKRVTRD